MPVILADTFLAQPAPADDVTFRVNWVQAAALAVTLPFFAWVAPRVSYRWFDCLFLLIPIYGLIWAFRMIWRLVFLPYRDWPPRADEA